MSKQHYRAVLEAAADGYNVFFPDFDGCTSWGATASEAALNATDALNLFLEFRKGPLPTPSLIEDPLDPEAEPSAFVLVPYEVAEREPAAA